MLSLLAFRDPSTDFLHFTFLQKLLSPPAQTKVFPYATYVKDYMRNVNGRTMNVGTMNTRFTILRSPASYVEKLLNKPSGKSVNSVS